MLKSLLVSAAVMVTLCAILPTQLRLFILSFAKGILGIGLALRSLLCTPCALLYMAILFLLCQTLPNHSKKMHPTLLQVLYLHKSMYLLINPLTFSARPQLVMRKTIVFMTMSSLQSLLIVKLGASILMASQLYSLQIKNPLFTSTLNFYSIKR